MCRRARYEMLHPRGQSSHFSGQGDLPASVVRSCPASIQLLMIQPWGSCCMIVTTDITQYEDRRLGDVSSSGHYRDGDAHCALTCRLRSGTGGSAVESKGPAVGILFSAKILWDVQAGWNHKKQVRVSMATGLVSSSTQMTALPRVYHSGGWSLSCCCLADQQRRRPTDHLCNIDNL